MSKEIIMYKKVPDLIQCKIKIPQKNWQICWGLHLFYFHYFRSCMSNCH